MSNNFLRPADIIILLMITIASVIGINQYTFGVYNHCITIPFIKNLLNPELYQNDYLIAEKQYFYTLFLPVCGLLINLFNASIPKIFFILYFISLYSTFNFVFSHCSKTF